MDKFPNEYDPTKETTEDDVYDLRYLLQRISDKTNVTVNGRKVDSVKAIEIANIINGKKKLQGVDIEIVPLRNDNGKT